MTKIISLVNQKGGVGKTTTLLSLAGTLSKSNKKVLIVDLDLTNGAIAISLNREANKTIFNFVEDYINNKYNDLDKYITTSTKVEQSSMDARLEKIYLDELENNIKSKFKNAGIEIIKCTIDAELDTTKKNAGIHSIDVKVKNVDDEKKISKIKQEIIEEYEISEDKVKIIIK